MIVPILTGADKFLKTQNLPSKSLGGFISSTPVQNESLNNLFGQISLYTLSLKKPEYRILALKNTGANKTNVSIHFVYPQVEVDGVMINDNICDFKVGEITVEADSCGDLTIEKLGSMYSGPYGATLVEAFGDSPLNIGDLESGDYKAIVIKRTLNQSAFEQKDAETLVAILNNEITVSTMEEISLVISWD